MKRRWGIRMCRKTAFIVFGMLLLQLLIFFTPSVAKEKDENENEPQKLRLQIRWNGTGRDDYWYRGGEDRFEFVAMVEECGGDDELTASVYCKTAEEEIGDITDKKEHVPVTDGQVSFGDWVYNREGAMEHGDQRQSYVVVVEDQEGNTVKSEAVEVRIDETGPEVEIYDGHPAVYYQFSNAAYEKMNNKDRVQESRIGDYLFQDILLSRTAVTVTVDIRDGEVKVDGETEPEETEPIEKESAEKELTETEPAERKATEKKPSKKTPPGSGIEKVVLIVNGQSLEPVEKPDGKDGEGIYHYQLPFLPGEEAEYRPETLELTDRAGNRTVYRFGGELSPEKIVVDGKIPEVDFLDEAYLSKDREGTQGWYSVFTQGRELRITANARDQYGIYSMEWYMTDEAGNVTQGPLTVGRRIEGDVNSELFFQPLSH